MKKKLSDHMNVGSERDTGQKDRRTDKSGNKGSVQSGDNSSVSKKIANIHRQ